jgi:hypothetical protein
MEVSLTDYFLEVTVVFVCCEGGPHKTAMQKSCRIVHDNITLPLT